jgi:hypothetical protein
VRARATLTRARRAPRATRRMTVTTRRCEGRPADRGARTRGARWLTRRSGWVG